MSRRDPVEESICKECHGTGELISFNGVFTDVDDCGFCGGTGIKRGSPMDKLLEENRELKKELKDLKNIKEELDRAKESLVGIVATQAQSAIENDLLRGIVKRIGRVMIDASQVL